MSLHLDVICTEPQHFELEQDRQESVVRVIGEILPFVLAKYRIEIEPAARTEVPNRFQDQSSPFRGC